MGLFALLLSVIPQAESYMCSTPEVHTVFILTNELIQGFNNVL